MKRRIIALLLALVMALGLVMPASATGPDGTTIGGNGEPVVITGEGTDTTTPVDGGETPATPSTPVDGEETPATPTTPTEGEDEDEDGTPRSLLGAMPLGGDTPVVTAVTTESTTYLDENGETKTVNAIPVTDSTESTVTWGVEGTTTYYVVNENLTINKTVTVAKNSDVRLILADDATLTVNGKATAKDKNNNPCDALGIIVGGSLTIYAQSEGTGKLNVTADPVNNDRSTGIIITIGSSLTINGGEITATGGAVNEIVDNFGYYSCGINAEGNMTINGGTVTAIGGTITGSTDGAKGESYGFSIAYVATVTVNGGKLTATGGTANESNMCSSGIYVYGTLNVKGGEVEATGGGAGNTSSGVCMRKYNNSAPVPKLNVDGGKVTATGGTGGSSIGISIYSSDTKPEVTLTSGTLIANSTGTSGNAFLYMPDSFTHLTVPNTYYLRTAASGNYTKYTETNNKYTLPQSGAYVELTTRPSGDRYLNYMDWDGTKLVDAAIEASTATAVPNAIDSKNYVPWKPDEGETEKWYYVDDTVTITERVLVTGNVNLILCDGATLTSDFIHIQDGGSLTIYGQSGQTGALTSTGSSSAIHIDGGSLTINGGTVTATTEGEAHGILNDGTLTINNGTVITEGGDSAIKNTPLILPATYWWRTAADGKYKTKAAYTADALTGTYFELTTAKPAENMLDKVKYLDWDSTNNKLKEDPSYRESPTKITNSMTALTGGTTAADATWYYVEDNVTITGNVTVTGHVNLILCDNATLMVNDKIQVGNNENQNSSLTIYAQSTGTDAGTLTTVNGGTDTAVGIDVYRSSLTINGGNINANGGTNADYESHGISIDYTSSMTVNSGKVTATGRDSSDSDSIGINLNSVDVNNNPTLTINGGEVTATGGGVTATGGGVTAAGKSYGIKNSEKGTVNITGGKVTAVGRSYGIYNYGAVNITGGEVIAKQAADSSGKAVYLDTSATFTLPTAYWWRTADNAKYNSQNVRYTNTHLLGTYFEVTTTQPTEKDSIAADPAVKYLFWNRSELVEATVDPSNPNMSNNSYTVIKAENCDKDGNIILTGSDANHFPLWYVVDQSVTIEGTMGIMGDVCLILCNGATLTVNKGIVDKNFSSSSNSGSLTIYGQSTGANVGKLVAYDAGIEGDLSGGIIVGALTIHSGEVEANGVAAPSSTAVTKDTEEKGSPAYISAGVFAMQLAVNGSGKLAGTGGSNAGMMSCGIFGMIMSVNEQLLYDPRGIEEPEEEGSTVVAAAPEIKGVGGDTTGGISIGILSLSMAVDGVNIGGSIMGADSYDLSEDDAATDSTTGATGKCSAKITATGGTVASAKEDGAAVTRAGLSDINASCGLFACFLHVGVSAEDIMSGNDDDDLSILGEGENKPTATTSAGSTAQINATGASADYSIGVATLDLSELTDSIPIPAVWLNGGKLTATGAMSGIYKLDLSTFIDLDTLGLLGLDTFGIDTYGGTEDGTETAPTIPTVYVQKGTLIADATGTGKGLALGDLVSATVPLQCPTEYWWRINKAVNGYKKYPSTAYSYNGTDAYVEITTEGEGLPLLPESGEDKTPPPADNGAGSAHQPIRRQNNAVAALVPSTDGKTDVTSPETFDAGIALYVGLGVLSLTGSAAWVGKRKKW